MNMMLSLSFSFMTILSMSALCFTAAGSCSLYRQNPPRQASEAALFMFGDSFLDSGNNNYINTTTLDQANFWPYGETYFRYPTGRFSDGRLISDFIAQYARLPLIPAPFLQPGNRRYCNGVNFASAGAGALVETFQGSVIDLKQQLKYFKKVSTVLGKEFGKVESKMILSEAVFLFSIGTNDYMSLFLTNSTMLRIISCHRRREYIGMVISNLTSAIHEVYRRGGRKFGFLNLGPLGCFPGLRFMADDGCLKEASVLAKLHNKALSKLLRRTQKQLRGFRYSLYDFNRNLRQRINHPYKYGFKEGKTACCGTGKYRGILSCGGKRPVKEFELCDNPNQYVFWDSYHLSESVYEQMADQMWAGATQAGYYNLNHFFHIS